MRIALVIVVALVTGCACKQPTPIQPDPPVRVSLCLNTFNGNPCAPALVLSGWMCHCTVKL